jgi:acylphosphatase
MITFPKKQNSNDKIRAHIFAGGRVQGVFYRETCRKKAEKLRVTGWIKNLKDGKVEGLFEGGKDEVEKMVDWARRGSIWASVDSFDIILEDYKGEFGNFEIRHDL